MQASAGKHKSLQHPEQPLRSPTLIRECSRSHHALPDVAEAPWQAPGIIAPRSGRRPTARVEEQRLPRTPRTHQASIACGKTWLSGRCSTLLRTIPWKGAKAVAANVLPAHAGARHPLPEPKHPSLPLAMSDMLSKGSRLRLPVLELWLTRPSPSAHHHAQGAHSSFLRGRTCRTASAAQPLRAPLQGVLKI